MRSILGLCVLVLLVGLVGIADGGGNYRGIPVDLWAYEGIAFVGFVGCLWCWRVMKKAKNKPEEPQLPLDEQCAQAKADLDQMYFREHGKLPEWPKKEEDKEERV